MASILIYGIIEAIRHLPNQGGCIVYVSEFKKGYKKKDGGRVEDRNYQWKVIYKQGLVKYITDHFSTGMVVEIKGDAAPFAVIQEKTVDGYTVFGQTMNMFSYPKVFQHLEERAIKESAETSFGKPDIQSFKADDF